MVVAGGCDGLLAGWFQAITLSQLYHSFDCFVVRSVVVVELSQQLAQNVKYVPCEA